MQHRQSLDLLAVVRLAVGDLGGEGARDPDLGGYNLSCRVSHFGAGLWSCPDLSQGD